VIELGTDVYYGHSAHVCQGIEIHRGKPILYDTGDFIDDYAVDPVPRNDRSCLFKLMFDQGLLWRIELIPVTLDVAQVALAHGEDFAAIASRMERLCAELGTALERQANRQADRLVYVPQPSVG
jgi:poly-gamma-glutamate synthesis protein (capsule biosynthesis protein)